MNVGYADINSADAAVILGVKKQTITYWCRHGYMNYIDVSGPKSSMPRYMFTEDEVDRIQKLIDKYGTKWMFHIKKETEEVAEPVSEDSTEVTDPEEYIVDDIDETIEDIKEIRKLKIQRDKLIIEIDKIEELIKEKRAKVIERI